jgi:hypothetical protein
MSVRYTYLLAIAAFLGCASGGGTSSGLPRGDRSLITNEEMARSRVTTAYGAVEQMRPLWLHSHGPTSVNMPGSQYATVYVNKQRYGDLTTLRSIPAEQAVEIRYYSPAESVTRFGAENTGGVIEVRMR